MSIFGDSIETPTLIIQGMEDQLVPYQQSMQLNQKIDSLNIPVEFHLILGVNHAFNGANTLQKDSIQNWIIQFVIRNNIH